MGGSGRVSEARTTQEVFVSAIRAGRYGAEAKVAGVNLMLYVDLSRVV
jgi:hypothetical protein